MNRILKEIRITSGIFPWTNLQDTPAGKQQIADARKFISEIERLAAELLPPNGHTLTIEEKYESR